MSDTKNNPANSNLDESGMASACPPQVGKKRRRNVEFWQKTKNKRLRVEGKECLTIKTKKKVQVIKPARKPVIDFLCKCRCSTLISKRNKEAFFEKFNSLPSHAAQNAFLSSLCIPMKPKQHKCKKTKPRTTSFHYFMEITYQQKLKRYKICKQALCNFLGILQSRLRFKIQAHRDSVSVDGRGHHNNCANRIDPSVIEEMRENIQALPARESHYSRHDNRHRKYLDSDLSIAKLHKNFIETRPELKNIVKYKKYYEIFTQNFNISFGYPRSDICDVCESLTAEIARAKRSGDQANMKMLEVEHKLHVSKGDAFYHTAQEVVALVQGDPTQSAFCFDFEKNFPLPLTGVGSEYYKRQLWIHVFDIHNMGTKRGTMFVYSEHFAGKGPNEVISMLDWFFKNDVSDEVKTIHLFADNCFSQNKNRYLWFYFQSLVDSDRFDQVNVYYPIPGHSRMACDRDFAAIEKLRRKKTSVSVPSEWVQLIRSARKINPYPVRFVEHPLTDNMAADGTPVIKIKDYKKTFKPFLMRSVKGLRTIRGLLVTKKGLWSRQLMTGLPETPIRIKKLGVKKKTIQMAINSAPDAFYAYLPIKPEKLADVKSLVQRVNLSDDVTFYSTLHEDENARDEEEVDRE